MLIIICFIITLLVIAIMILVVGWHFCNIIIYPNVREYNNIYNNEVKDGKIIIEKFNNLEKQEVYIDRKSVV